MQKAAWIEEKKILNRALRALKPFDPYSSPLCACPPKLSLNVYTGCGFECFYCYTSSYLFGRWGYGNTSWGPKLNLIENLKKDIEKIEETPAWEKYKTVAVSLSSDPYPETKYISEKKLSLTRQCLKLLSENRFRVLLQTKSPLFLRELDILDPLNTVIGVTITTMDEKIAGKIEKYAPSPKKRLAALAQAAKQGFKTLVRIDPLIPEINTDVKELGKMTALFADSGIKQVIFSAYKRKHDSQARFSKIFPAIEEKTRGLYDFSKSISGYFYMKEPLRRALLLKAVTLAVKYNLPVSVCREGFTDLNTAVCDGRGLL